MKLVFQVDSLFKYFETYNRSMIARIILIIISLFHFFSILICTFERSVLFFALHVSEALSILMCV